MTSFLAPQNHALGMFQVKEIMKQQLFKKKSLKSIYMVKKRKDDKTASKEMGAPNKQQHIDFQLIFKKVNNAEEKTGKKIGLSYIIPHT